MTPADKLKEAIVDIEAEMEVRVGELETEGAGSEAARLRQRTHLRSRDASRARLLHGVENYRGTSRAGTPSRPWTLLYFPPDWLLVVDESHMTAAGRRHVQERPYAQGDPGRFRVPAASALDNRPLTFEEFEGSVHQAIYMSATPGPYELEKGQGHVIQQLIRPRGSSTRP